MPFQLLASGNFFDVDGFLATSKIGANRIFRRGETRSAFSSGFVRQIGEAKLLSYEEQVRAAVIFIDVYREELRHLMMWPGVTEAQICLAPQVEMRQNISATRGYGISKALMQA